jgi:hypothetical protein
MAMRRAESARWALVQALRASVAREALGLRVSVLALFSEYRADPMRLMMLITHRGAVAEFSDLKHLTTVRVRPASVPSSAMR